MSYGGDEGSEVGFSTARDEGELLNRSVVAAGEVSGLSTAAILVTRRTSS